MITKMKSMKLVRRDHQHFQSLRRRGVVCWNCGDQLIDLERAPGHIMNCDECHEELRSSRKNHHHYNTPSAKLRPLRKRNYAPNSPTSQS